MYRNSAFTFTSGTTIEKVFFKVNIFVIGFISLLRIGMNANFGPDILQGFDNSTFAVAGFVPYFIVSITIPFTIFNKEYFRLTRYYQISLLETYKYYLSEVYSKRNLFIVIILPVIIELFSLIFFNTYNYLSIIVFDTAFLLSIVFITPTFLLTTFFKKRYIALKILVPFILYMFSTVAIIRFFEDFKIYFVPIVVVFDLIMLIIIYVLIKQRDKYMEV